MSSIVLNESEWNRIKTRYLTERENKKEESVAIKQNKFRSGNENEKKKKQIRSDEEDGIEKKGEVPEEKEKEEEEEKNFGAGDILRFIKKGTKSGSLESEWRRRILSGAALAAILYERDNQLRFINKQNKFKEEKNKIKIQEEMNWPEGTKFDKASKEKLMQVLSCQLNERKVKEDEKKWEKTMERKMLEKMMKKHLEQVRKEAEEKRFEKMKAREEMANDLEERRRRKSKEKQREMEEEELRNVYKQVEERLERKKKIMEKLLLESEAKKKVGKTFEKILENVDAKNQREEANSNGFRVYEKGMVKSADKKPVGELGGKKAEEAKNAKKKLIKDEMRKEREREREMRLDFDNRWNQEEKKRVKNEKKKIFIENLNERNRRREIDKIEKDREKICFLTEETDNKNIDGFCEFVLKEAEVHKRPLFPVLAAIDDVKRQCGMIKRNKKIRHFLSSF